MEYIVSFIILVFLFGMVFAALYFHKNRAEYEYAHRNDQFEIHINPKKPVTKEIAKLVRKKIDKIPLRKNQYYRRLSRVEEPYGVPYDRYYKYYITFETFKGYKSFTVPKDTYHKVSNNTYGYLSYQKTKFIKFEVRNRDDLHIDELIKKGENHAEHKKVK